MSTVSQSTTSTASNSLDSSTDFSSAQASAYAQALLTGTNVNPAAFKDASALQRCQIALDKKSQEVETLQAELSRMKVSITTSTTRKSRRRSAGDTTGTTVDPLKDRITKDVRALAAMECLWLGKNSFQQPPLLANPFPSAPDRYASDENLDLYHTYILYTHFHVDYHGPLEGSGLLRSEVLNILSQERSTLVKNIRKSAKDIFFGFPLIVAQAVFMREYARAREPECLRFLISPRQVPSSEIRLEDPMPPLKYLDLPPLLFPELDSTRVQEIFRSDVLIQIARCILFGEKAPGCAVARQQGHIEGNAMSSNCLARQRNITTTTPGLIAAAAILACFVVSGDTVFLEKGTVTGAAYKSRYLKFKLLLEESQEASEPHTIATFKFWDQQLFALENGNGEHFEFDSMSEGDEDELSKHRRAVMRHASPASMQASSTGPLTSHHSVSAARPNSSLQSAPTSTSGPPPHQNLLTTSISSGQPTPQITPSPSPGVQSDFGGPIFTPHLSIMARPSAPIPASQPGSQVYLNHDNEEDGLDTEPDSDATPTASEAPISRCESPTITLPVTSHLPPANDCVIVEPPTTRVNLVGEQPMAPGSNEMNLATQRKNSRRGRPPNKNRQSARPGPSGLSTHDSVQQGSGPNTTVAAAAAPIRSKLRSRANMGKH